ncbi:MAG: DUF1499 domain-containing protein [Candidatus Binatia bacterium]
MTANPTSRLGTVSTWLGRLSLAAAILGPTLAYFELVKPIVGFAIFGVGGVLSGVLCLVLGVIALLLGPAGSRGHTGGGMLPALIVILAVYVANGAGTSAPRINDITTDTANPPAFSAATTLPDNAGRDMSYPGEAFAAQQRDGYGEIAPLALPLPPDQAFATVLAAAQKMPGWYILRNDSAAHIVEGYETSRLFHFKDDFVIEVRPDGAGSVVQMRSKSRDGQGDMGANAKRIRAFFATIQP